MNRHLALLFIYIFSPVLLLAQGAAVYTATRQTGITFSSISATGISVTSWRGGNNTSDNRSTSIPIGFSFNYLGINYTTFCVSTNGFIDFSSNAATGVPYRPYGFDNTAFSIPAPDGTLLAIAPFYDNLMVTWGYLLSDNVKFITTGTSGNKVLTVEWINFSFEQSNSDHVNFQVKLYEADSKIEFVYGSMNAANITPSYTCGINATVMSVPPASSELLTLQSPNTTTFTATPQNNLNIIPESNSKIILTGCILPAPAGTISGPSSVCKPGIGYIYSVPLISGALGYTWTLPAGFTMVSGGSTNTITVDATSSATAGNITVSGINNCGYGTPSSKAVSTIPSPTPTITGQDTVCAGTTNHVYTTQTGMSNYTWTVSAGGTITAGGTSTSSSATVSWIGPGTQSVSVNYKNSLGCAAMIATSLPVLVYPLPTPAITGPTQVCIGSTENSYSTESGMTNYLWTISSGGTITAGGTDTSNTVTIKWNTSGSQTVKVNYTNSNGCQAPQQTVLNVTVHSLPVPVITGPSPVCINSTNNIYSTLSGMTNYLWTVSTGGVITSGAGTSSITVSWNTTGAKTVSVTYLDTFGCSPAAPTVFNVTVQALPVPTIQGPTTSCMGSTGIIYTTETGMLNYQWNISSGGTITGGDSTNVITVTWNNSGPQSVSVSYANPIGCASANPTTKPVTVNTLPVPTITGNANPCINSGNYPYSTEIGMTGYQWTVSPGGLIASGSGTNKIYVNWISGGSQWVKVNYTSPAGCSAINPTNFDVTVNPMPGTPGTITGMSLVCSGSSGIPYSVDSVANATTYIWNLPMGATIASGEGSRSITVDFSATASSGNITVSGNNSCGGGAPSPAFPVSVTTIPLAADTITGPDTVAAGSTGVIYSIPPVAHATSYLWTLPQGASITSGDSTNVITVDFPMSAVSGNITTLGYNLCGTGEVSPSFPVTVIDRPAAPVIYQSFDFLISNYTSGNQWYLDGTMIPGATGQKIQALQNGWYWDVVTLYGLQSDTSNNIYVVVTGTIEKNKDLLLVYPVPNEGRFFVSLPASEEGSYSITVYNQLGLKIYDKQNIRVNEQKNETIDLRPVSPGIYTLVCSHSKGKIIRKIIVKK
ncbi:MAG: T9SS type A sorting domain-containing protein [Bacteroidales bacterium]|nr:T9SS type A sorting domain-containing protein [Bacteroidales bacterium]